MTRALLSLICVLFVVFSASSQDSDRQGRSDAQTHFENGLQLEWRGEFATAVVQYSAAIAADHFHVDALTARARVHGFTGRFDDARTDVDVLKKCDPFVGLLEEGSLLEYEDRLADSIDVYRRAALLDASSPLPHLGTGGVNMLLGDYVNAADSLSRAILLTPRSGRQLMYLWRARAYRQLARFDDAIRDINDAIDVCRAFSVSISEMVGEPRKPNDEQLFIERANCYLEMNQPERAISDYSYVINKMSQKAFPYFKRSIAYKALGDFARSRDDMKKAKSIDPTNAELGRLPVEAR